MLQHVYNSVGAASSLAPDMFMRSSEVKPKPPKQKLTDEQRAQLELNRKRDILVKDRKSGLIIRENIPGYIKVALRGLFILS